jgi:hypothetical protein
MEEEPGALLEDATLLKGVRPSHPIFYRLTVPRLTGQSIAEE